LSRRTAKKQLEIFTDSRVQHFLGRFLNGQLSKINPTLNEETGYKYPEVESLVGNHEDVEPFLESLVNHGLLIPSISGMLACCTTCGSCKLSGENPITVIPLVKKGFVKPQTGFWSNLYMISSWKEGIG